MKQVLVNKGEVTVDEVPAPTITKNSVLVGVSYSVISAGTEISGVAASGESLLRRAWRQPEKVKEVLNTLKAQGFTQTVDIVKAKLDTSHTTGYSCAGIVIESGENIKDIKVGDSVACAGAGYANHAEIVCVPRNLVVKVPDNLPLREAASVTLGAIAMQGVRRSNLTVGETIAVIGLGLIGQITVQILKVAGCRVIGIDLIQSRVELARSLGMDYGVNSEEDNPVSSVLKYTAGFGVDATIITAATSTNLPVQQAMEMTRKKGKVIVVGDVGLHLKRQPFYEKEIDFLISCSYGPGRYDENYEERGIDYPYAYVRWTENRNMQEYLMMLAEGKVDFKRLISAEYDIEDASQAYKELKKSESKPLGILLRYGQDEEKISKGQVSNIGRKIILNPRPVVRNSKLINVAVIGTGNFARTVHLPNLNKLSKFYNIHAIVTRTGSNASRMAKRFKADYCTTNYQEALRDENIDMVLIATRHNLHAKMAMEAAQAGKAVFSEKPMALNREELDKLVKVLEEAQVPFMVGFNRRFSPCAVKAKKIIKKRQHPIIINYRVNAGYIPLDHWVHTEEGGGRIIGEACHMFDLFNYFTDSELENVDVSAISPKTTNISPCDNFTATLKYCDGSVCVLTYTALGAREQGKEYIEMYVDGTALVIDDFKTLSVFGLRAKGTKSRAIQKGYLEELEAFAKYVKGNSDTPISLVQLINATEISFIVDGKIRG